MLVLEVIIAATVVVFVVGGMSFVLVLERSGRRPRFSPLVWWWSLVGFALIGVAIAWSTSSISY